MDSLLPMELTPLRYFREIARAGHMTRAARTLGVSQPALSAMLKKLEAEVGAPLLHRIGRGVKLTDAGRVFLTHAEDALRRAEAGLQAVRQLMGLETGSIRIGGGATAASYLLPPVISAVRKKHPGLRFYIREAGSSQVAQAILSGELDLGIVTLPVRVPGDNDLLTLPLVEDELRLIVPPGHPLAPGPGPVSGSANGAATPKSKPARSTPTFRWKDLAGEPIIGFEAGSAVREVLDHAAAAAGVRLNVVMELRSIQSIMEMVAAGIGVGFVSRFALQQSSRFGRGLVCRESKLTRKLAIVRRRDQVPSPAAAEFERLLIPARKS